jgi:DNA-binding GntR family transcriptional regulator
LDKDTSLVTQAFRHLRTAILTAECAPGTRLRLEALQERYGLSSSPLREALNRLAAEGLVEVVERRGFRVKPVSIDELNDLTRVRLLVEREALRQAMQRGGDDWEADVVAAFHRLKLAQGRLSGADMILDKGWSTAHLDFHRALVAACGSPNLIQLCASFFEQAQRYRNISARFRKTNGDSSASHRRLMNAVLSRQCHAADTLITAHIEETARNVAAALDTYPFNDQPAARAVRAQHGDVPGGIKEESRWS